MFTKYLTLSLLLLTCTAAHADIEKNAVTCETGICFYWWPTLPNIKGWHHDRKQSLISSLNVQAPDGKTAASADTVIYAEAIYKQRMPEIKSIKMLIERDQKQIGSEYSTIEIREAGTLKTGDGDSLQSFTYKRKRNFDQLSYGEEGEYFLIFSINSHSQNGFNDAHEDYLKFIAGYKKSAKPTKKNEFKLQRGG